MVGMAAVFLTLTTLALFNAKDIDNIFEYISGAIEVYLRARIGNSALVRSRKDRQLQRMRGADEEGVEVKQGSGSSAPQQKGRPQSYRHPKTTLQPEESSWLVLFWLACIFVELPARRVLLAYEALQDPKDLLNVGL